MNTRTILIILFLILTSAGMIFPAPQTVIRCKVKSNKANPLSLGQAPLQISEKVLSKSTNEYHVQVEPNSNKRVRIKLTNTSPGSSTSPATLDLYSLDPTKVIKKKIDSWEGDFDKKKYLLAVNNCMSTKQAQFLLVVERTTDVR